VRDRASTRQDTRPAGGDGHTGLHLALGRVGDRWSLLVVQALLVGPRRFNELQACGTAAEPRWWCPTCERGLDDDELDDLRWI